jgi:hypothetical protein
LQKQRIVDTLQTGANGLSNAADDVFAQGIGARKKVFYSIPTEIDRTQSGIQGRSFVFRVFNTDIIGKANQDIVGSIPLGIGGHEVWLTAYENYVFAGTENISLDKTSVFVSLQKSSSATSVLTIRNTGPEATVSLAQNWPHSNVSLALSDSSFLLATGSQKQVTLSFTSGAAAAGNYSGILYITAPFSDVDENISIPIDAEIVAQNPSLVVMPSEWVSSLAIGASESKDFNVCNISTGSLSGISFTGSSGEPGSYVQAVSSIATLPAETCVVKTISIDTTGATAGNHTGSIDAADSGSANTDSIDLDITIS